MTESHDVVAPPEETATDLWAITEPGIPLFMSNTLTIKPERVEEYLAALREVLPAARAEPNCIYLNVGPVADRTRCLRTLRGVEGPRRVPRRHPAEALLPDLPADQRERLRPAAARRAAHPRRTGTLTARRVLALGVQSAWRPGSWPPGSSFCVSPLRLRASWIAHR